jgi:hypothetical protein
VCSGQWSFLMPRILDFGKGPSMIEFGSGNFAAAKPSTILNTIFGNEDDCHLDIDWRGDFADFGKAFTKPSGISLIPCSDGSFAKKSLLELELRDPDEDNSGWPFALRFADSQWHKIKLILFQDT